MPYGIPAKALEAIRARYERCVYCRKVMTRPSDGGWPGDWATIEHLNYKPPWNDPSTVVMSCGSRNSSRGSKPLLVWFETAYCRARGIALATVPEEVSAYVRSREAGV